VLIHATEAATRSLRTSLRRVTHRTKAGLFDVVLELTNGSYEIVVLDIDRTERAPVNQLITALRRRADTRGLALVGMSRSEARRRRFVTDGGDAAVSPAGSSVLAAIRWLTGVNGATSSDGVLLSDG
jgi:hypothetical protein